MSRDRYRAKWVAISHATGAVIAAGRTFEECSANAEPFWPDKDSPAGSAAPYIITLQQAWFGAA